MPDPLIRKYYDCQCSCLDHVIRFTIDPYDGDIWLEVKMNKFKWYERLLIAVKYIFGFSNTSHYEETLLRHEDFKEIKELFDLSDRTRDIASKNSVHIEDNDLVSLQLNCREARALERLVSEARAKNAMSLDRPSHDGVHTVHTKLVETYERLLEHEKRNNK
jgi:hypothetical protein